MKAFLITIDNWSKGNQSVYAAETAGKAKYQAYLAAYEAGITIPITRFRAVRARQFDELAAQKERTCCIGWSVDAAGPYGREAWGCLANVVQAE